MPKNPPKTLRCECRGLLKPVKLNNVDLTAYLGLKVTLTQVLGLRCTRCGREAVPGPVLDRVMRTVALRVIETEELLSAELARYLRRFLGLHQGALAKRMAISRQTVNDWEGNGHISTQNDFVLRALVYVRLAEESPPDTSILDFVRTAPPPAKPPRFVLKGA